MFQRKRSQPVTTDVGKTPSPQESSGSQIISSELKTSAIAVIIEGIFALSCAVCFYVLGAMVVSKLPWYLAPLGYLGMGFAMTGLYDVGFACTSLSSRRRFGSVEVSRVIGQASLLLLLRPLQSLHVESLPQQGANMASSCLVKLRRVYSFRSLLLSAHQSSPDLRAPGLRIGVQIAVVCIFAAIFFPTMILNLGWSGLVRFWLVPFVYMQFQLGSFSSGLSLKEQQRLAAKYSPYSLIKGISQGAFHLGQALVTLGKTPTSTISAVTSPASNTAATVAPVPDSQQSTGSEAVGAVAPQKEEEEEWRIHKFNTVYLCLVHLGGIYGVVLCTTLQWAELRTPLCLAASFYLCGALGITAGAHRLWSHCSYEAHWSLRLFLMVCNCIANQGSILRWSRDHRLHHKHVDTPKDPHDATKGFWWSHCGWLLYCKPSSVMRAGKSVHLEDLHSDPVVMFQHRYYSLLALSCSFALPTVIGWFLGCAWSSYWIAGLLRYCCILHATWMVNSAAHLWGYRPYLPEIMPAENWFVALCAIGEGWHNYHHAYPYDYSTNEYGFLQLNLTTGFIDLCALMGLVKHRRRATHLNVDEKSLENLPEYTMPEVKACANQASCVMVLDNAVYDLTGFEKLHPGGPKILRTYYGKDASQAFHGGVHKHTVVATNMLKKYQIGTLAVEGSTSVQS